MARTDLFLNLPHMDISGHSDDVESEPEIDPELVERLRREHNITKEARVMCKMMPLTPEQRQSLKVRLYGEEAESMSEEEKLKTFKKNINDVLDLILEKAIIDTLDEDGTNDAYGKCIRMLESLNEEYYSIDKGIPEYECLSQNIKKILIKVLDESDLKAIFHDAQSVEEALLLILSSSGKQDENASEASSHVPATAPRRRRGAAQTPRDRSSHDDTLSHSSLGSHGSRATDTSATKRRTRQN